MNMPLYQEGDVLIKQHKSWFDGKTLKFKIQRLKCENIWHRSKCELHKRQYILADK